MFEQFKLQLKIGKLSDMARQMDELRRELRARIPSHLKLNPFQEYALRELEALEQNLTAAVNALSTRKDQQGRPITPQQIGIGLGRMCEDTLDNSRWAGKMEGLLGEPAGPNVLRSLRDLKDMACSLQQARA